MEFVNQIKYTRAKAIGKTENEIREAYLALGGLIKDDEGPKVEEPVKEVTPIVEETMAVVDDEDFAPAIVSQEDKIIEKAEKSLKSKK